jgi:serine/threonine protein kinase
MSSLSGSEVSLTGRLVLGRYRVVRTLARGGMGIVYLGRIEGSAGFAKPVVIKSVASNPGSDSQGTQLFAREARIVSNLQHPNIVAVIDFGKVDGSHVMVLEYVHGYNLGQWLRFLKGKGTRMPVSHAVHAVLSVLDALEFAHGVTRPDGSSFGIVHRDVSPGNVLIDTQGHVKLGDFGIARSADDEYRTQRGTFRGTLSYAAPETIGGAPPSPSLDQYAVGVVLYQLLAGVNPLRGQTPGETISRIATLVPAPLRELREDVPEAIDAAIARAISKDAKARFATIADFAKALRAGATWSEREAAQSFASQIRDDFSNGDLPDALGIESLAIRDASWRGAPAAVSIAPPAALDAGSLPSTRTAPLGPVAPSPAAPVVAPDAASGRLAFAIVAAGVLAAGSILFLSRRAPAEAPKVLVVEKQETPAPLAAPPEPVVPVAKALEAPQPGSPPAAPNVTAARRAPAAPSPDPGAVLARAFQRQESQIEGCFQRFSAGLEPSTQISIRFQIDAAGKVQRVQVVPGSLAATPLGSCLATLAQNTAFGPQPQALTFAIPLSARVVRR